MDSIQRVLVVGTGLIGTSIAFDLRQHGVYVGLNDINPANVDAAVARRAGEPHESGESYDIAIVATPPFSVVPMVQQLLEWGVADLVIDVASTKGYIAEATRRDLDPSRFIPSHPMAGREVAGPEAAQQGLFKDKAWAITPLEGAASQSIERVEQLIRLCGAKPLRVDPEQHDRYVAVVSHAVHVVSSALAGSLLGQEDALTLSGTALPETIRPAAGDADLWTGILSSNAANTAEALRRMHNEIGRFVELLDGVAKGERRANDALSAQLRKGQRGKMAVDAAIERRFR